MKRLPKLAWGLIIGLAFGTTLGGGVVYVAMGRPGAPGASREPVVSGAHDAHEGHDEDEHDEEGHAPGLVELAREKWKPAGIEIAPVRRDSLTLSGRSPARSRRTRTGWPTSTRWSRASSMRSAIRYGDRVEAGDELAVIDSREVGAGQACPGRGPPTSGSRRSTRTGSRRSIENVQALIEDLEAESPVAGGRRALRGPSDGRVPRAAALGSYAQTAPGPRRVRARPEPLSSEMGPERAGLPPDQGRLRGRARPCSRG